jgi:signal transduction histidine kinase
MTCLVDDLLKLAKATGVDDEPVGTASVREAFDAACSNLNAEIQAAGATITSSPLPEVAAREFHVVIVLQNILGNGLKYRSAEPPVIEVSARRHGSQWIIAVKDNGIGIDAKYADRIFQPFKRLHGAEYEGTGLGLWTCKKIVSRYGGDILVESEPGQGSVFFFSMPAVAANADASSAGA